MLTRILKYKQNILKYQIEYKKNIRNIRIKILPTGEPLVVAPEDIKVIELDNIVKDKFNWIKNKQKAVKERLSNIINIEYKEDEVFYYLGNPYILKLCKNDGSGERVIIQSDEGILNVYLDDIDNKEVIKKLLKSWFEKKADLFLKQEVNELFNKYKKEFDFVKVLNVKVKNVSSYWGKCKYVKSKFESNVINKYEVILNQSLIHAPKKLIDFVILHEFSHFIFPNHSKDFESFLKKLVPNFKEIQKDLNENKDKCRC